MEPIYTAIPQRLWKDNRFVGSVEKNHSFLKRVFELKKTA